MSSVVSSFFGGAQSVPLTTTNVVPVPEVSEESEDTRKAISAAKRKQMQALRRTRTDYTGSSGVLSAPDVKRQTLG